jgi:hypothetical protein
LSLYCLCGLVVKSSWLQMQGSRVRFPGTTKKKVVGLERGPFSLVSATEILERKSNGFGLESREYSLRDPSLWSRGTFYPQKFTLTSPTSGGRSVGIVRSRTQKTEFLLLLILINYILYIFIYIRGSRSGPISGTILALCGRLRTAKQTHSGVRFLVETRTQHFRNTNPKRSPLRQLQRLHYVDPIDCS